MAPEPLALLRGMAACRDLLPVPLVSALVGLEETSTVSALRALRAAGLVTSDQPPRLTGLVNPERVLSAMDDADRQALYEQAAELGHQAALQDEALADLLLRARPSGAPWVSGTLRRVAAACRARGEHRRAVRCLARALQEPLPADEHARLLVELGTAGCLTDPDAADRFLVQALHGTGRHGGTWNRPTAADLLLARGDAVAARHALAAAYPAARDDEQERAALLALHWFAENARLDESGLEGILSDMPALPAVPQDPSGLAAAAWQAATVGQDAARARNLGLAALDFPLRGLPLYPRLFACRALGVTDEVDAAHTGLSAALAEARRRQMPPLVGLALLFSCELHLRCGDIGRAARDLAMARIEMPISAWHPTMAPAVQALEVRIRVARDQLDAAENIAYLDCPVGGEQRYSWPQLLFARGVLRLAQGRPQEAAAELRECGRWLLARGWTSPGLMAWRPVRAIAHACSGESAEAARLLAEEQRLAARWATPSALGTVDLISGLLAEGDPAVRLLECAVQRLRVSPAADLYVLALAQLASARDRLGERDSSCSLQAEAAQLAAGLGHTLMHDRLRTDR
ncbi:hypothetical protein [Peterkaempfera bronchialis]|uniref:Uncharacterized protein n=2 Tax=Peterkaempfera bronchialis TaxID=2126346 RepID=A0A345T2V6_9ACTN|nr:hypothetical protein [Peterkaempfera bronchialis]AXI80311.1 hypothetical protein C7M71_025840 [Peterkaempfera bronchialis]